MAIMRDLPGYYSAVDGIVVHIKNVGVDAYEVWISQDERIDIVAYKVKMLEACKVIVEQRAERSARQEDGAQ